MNSIIFLKAAYAVSWIIYLGYLVQILLRMKKVTVEQEELQRSVVSNSRQEAFTTETQRH